MSFEDPNNQREQSASEQFDESEQSLLGKFRERLGGKVGRGLLSVLRLGTVAWTLSREPDEYTHAAASHHDATVMSGEYNLATEEGKEKRIAGVLPRDIVPGGDGTAVFTEEVQDRPTDVPAQLEGILALEPQSDALKRLLNPHEIIREALTSEEEDIAHEELKKIWSRDPEFGLKNFERFQDLKNGKVADEFLDWLLAAEEDEVSFGFPRAGFAYAGYQLYKNHPHADAIFKIAEELVKGGLLFQFKLPKDELRAMENLAKQYEQTGRSISVEIKKLNEHARQRAEEDRLPFTW